jgi:hypothetical protein
VGSMNPDEKADEAVAGAQDSNPFGNLFGIFLEPKETFQKLRQTPNWLLPLVASLVLVGVGNFIVIEKVGIANILKAALKSNPQADQILEMAKESTTTRVIMHAAPLVSLPFGILSTVATLLLLLALSSEEANFKKVFCVVSYSFFAYACVTTALAVLMVLVTADGSKILHGSRRSPQVSVQCRLFSRCPQSLVPVPLGNWASRRLYQFKAPEVSRARLLGMAPLRDG